MRYAHVIRLVGLGIVWSALGLAGSTSAAAETPRTTPAAAPTGITIDGQKVTVQSRSFTAVFDGADLVSVVARSNGTEFCRRDSAIFPLELVYLQGDVLRQDKHPSVEVKRLSPLAARIIISGNDSDRELLLSLDPSSGDLRILPSGRSARAGLLAARWNIAFAREASLVLPCVNGLLVEAARAHPPTERFAWPYRWNAQLAIAQRGASALMVHSEDTACKFKALYLARGAEGQSALGFDSEQVGPVWQNRAAGGVEWRLNVYDGDWKAPATRYREWLQRTYQLEAKRAARPAWVNEISLAYQWSPSDVRLLDALAKLHAPQRTLIHLSDWRTSKYDQDYPDYRASAAAEKFLEKANAMGFKVMPHFNYFACYNKHPLFQQVRDWQIRSAGRNEPEGWYWPPESHDYTRMAYIHPGLGLWRRTLIDAVREAAGSVQAPAVFLDQTLCTWNTDNGQVENLNMVEGMRQLQEELAAIQPELVLAGEGLNEISFQREAFAQAHIHNGWGELKQQHVDAQHSICAFLWQGHTRLIGYYHLNPRDKDVDLGIEVYRRMGIIPTLICPNPDLIVAGNPAVKKILDWIGPAARREGP